MRIAATLKLTTRLATTVSSMDGLYFLANLAKVRQARAENQMQILTAKDAKYGFGRLIDLARAEPVAVAKHGRTVVVVLAVEEYERLKALDKPRMSLGEHEAGKNTSE